MISDEDAAILASQKRIVLRNCGLINPERIEEYMEADGYQAAKKGTDRDDAGGGH